MIGYRRKSISKFFTSSKIIFIISLFVLVFFSVNLVREFINRKDVQKDINKLQDEINSLESKNTELGGLIGYFKSLDFVEKEARTKLNLRKPGEKIIIVPDDPSSVIEQKQHISSVIQAETNNLSNPQRWWKYFFKLKI